ncbi:MAG: extracellular solute-binding protein [Butyricicoccus sp.]|nr:extracellular solute-binding protein [Butyricicoccus sp.]
MKGTKRYLCLILALAIALCAFTGCGKKDPDDNSSDPNNPNGGSNAAELSGFVYVPEYVTIQGQFRNSFYGGVPYGDKLYVSSYEVIEDRTPEGVTPEYEGEYWIYGPVIYKISMDGSCEKISFALSEVPEEEGVNANTSMDNFAVAKDGSITMLERTYKSWVDIPEGVEVEEYSDEYWQYYQSEEHYALRTVAADGSDISSFPLDGLGEDTEYFYVNSFTLDDDGNVYLGADDALYVLNPEGELLCRLETPNWIQKVMQFPDGRMVCSYYGDNGQEMTVIDLENKSFGEKIKIPIDLYDTTIGGGDYDLYYTNGSNFFGYNLGSEEGEKILNWLNCDVNTYNTNGTMVLDDGRIVVLSSEWDDNYDFCTNELIILSQKPASSVPQKTIITLAAQYVGMDTRDAVINFNRNNDTYRIEVQDYSEYNTEEDYEAGLTKLTTEILSGNVPDIFAMDGMPLSRFASKGLVEDLYPYIDSDPELGRDKLMTGPLSAFEVDGKLYNTVSSFYVNAVMGAESVVGDTPGWTYDEFNAALRSMPEGCDAFDQYVTRDEMLSTCMALDGADYVNWATGECRFDSEEFIKMLEFVNSFPAEYDWENHEYTPDDETDARIASGRQMLMSSTISDFQDFLMYDAMFGGKATYIGYPTENGTGNMISTSGGGYAMSSKCASKDGAWQFLRQFFLGRDSESRRGNVMVSYGGFPINKADFDKKLEQAMTPEYEKDENGNYVLDENGNKIEVSQGGWSWGSITIEYRAITQEEADRILELINTTTKSRTSDESILEIVREEAAPFFAGQKTAEEAAKLIQNKASLYVNEQR